MTYRIRNWRKFQHYADRCPPWVKLHYDLLTSQDWVMLDDSGRALLVVCLLIASRNNGDIPNNNGYVRRVAYMDREPDFGPLVQCGFLVPVQADASVMQADASTVLASATQETETETETEAKSTPRARACEDGQAVWPEAREVVAYATGMHCAYVGFDIHAAEYFLDHYRATGKPLADWKAAIRNWKRRDSGKWSGVPTTRRTGDVL